MEAGLQLPLCISNAPCNDTGLPEEMTEEIKGKERKCHVQGVYPDPHEDQIKTTNCRGYN